MFSRSLNWFILLNTNWIEIQNFYKIVEFDVHFIWDHDLYLFFFIVFFNYINDLREATVGKEGQK